MNEAFVLKKKVNFFKILSLLMLLVLVGQLTQTINIPIIVNISHFYHISPTSVQSMATAFLLPYGFFQFIWGPLSDYIGRKRVILLGLLFFIAGIVISLVAYRFEILLIGSFFQGLGIAVAGVMARTIMFDCYEGEDLMRANSFVCMCIILGPLLAPLIGGFLGYHFGWRSVFLFLGVFSIFVLVMQVLFFVETKDKSETDFTFYAAISSFMIVFRCTKFKFNLVHVMISMSAISVLETNLGVILGSVLKFNSILTSLIFIIPVPAFLLGSLLVSKYSSKISSEFFMLMGILITFFAAILTLVFGLGEYITVFSILLPSIIIFFGAGIIFPVATTNALENLSSIAGTAGSIFGGAQSIGAAICVGVASCFHISNQLPLGIILCILLLFSTILLIVESNVYNKVLLNDY